MSHKFTGEAGAALLFAILYFAVLSWMLLMYLTHRIKWRSRWSLLFFHITIRVASQACGVGFGILGLSNINIFLAFLVLGAEGYFTLVLCAYRFLISWHQHNLPHGKSWLEPRRGASSALSRDERRRRFLAFLILGPFALLIYRDNVMAALHLILMLANAVIIAGGSFLAGANLAEWDSADTQRRLGISRKLRTAGQSVFLACNALLLVFMLVTARNDRRTRRQKEEKELAVHPTLVVLLITWIPLIVRGAFGVIQSADYELSYYNPNNYGDSGYTPHFTVVEYLMGVLTEWLSCVLLCSTYFTSKNDPPKLPVGQNPTPHQQEDAAAESKV